jgi:stage V sporulation protein B
MKKILDSQLQEVKSILASRTIKDSLVIVSGDLLNAGIGFISSIIVIRALGPTAYGLLAISMAVMATASHMLDLGVRTSGVRFISLYLKTDKEKAEAMMAAVFKVRLIVGLIILIGGFFIAKPLALNVFKKPELVNLLRLAFVGCFGALLYDFIMTDLQANQWFKKLAKLNVSVTSIKLLLVVFLVFIQAVTVSKIVIIYILTPFLGFVIGSLLIPWRFIRAPGNRGKSFRVLFRFSKWVMISFLLAGLYNRAEVFLLGYFKESATVGIYSAAHTLVLPITLICASLTKVLLPKVTGLDRISKLSEYLKKAVKLLIGIGILLLPYYFLAPFIMGLIGNKYVSALPVFRILFFYAFIVGLASPIIIILYSLNKPHVIAFINIGQFCFSFTMNYLVIPSYGAQGAAVVALSSFGLAAIVEIGLVFRYLRTEKSIIKIE